MTLSKKLIENVECLKKSLNEISVYDLDVYTSMELYYKIAKKLNEVITELMRFEGLVSDEVVKQNEKLIYLLGEGLNIEVVKKINEMIADGTMDTIINHNVFTSLNNKIDEFKSDLDSQIKDKANISDIKTEVVSNRVRGQNSADSPAGAFDFANFAQQGKETGIASTPIGGVIHHYTDGKVLQIDNVGEGNVIVTMVNANNPTRRPDKASTFFGTGYFLQLMTNNQNTGQVYSHFVIDQNGNPFWGGVKPSGAKTNTTTFTNAKDDGSLPCFEFVPVNKHVRPYQFKNGSSNTLMYIEENGEVCSIATPKTYVELKGVNARIVGTEISLVGTVKAKGLNSDMREVQLREVGARTGYSTESLKTGMMIFDNTLNKPLWWNGTAWVDATGATV